MTRGRVTPGELATELALLGLGVATALGLCRLFVGWSFLPAVLLATVAAHLIAMGCRRVGLGLLGSAVVSFGALAVVVTLAFYRDTSWAGFLPSGATLDALGVDLRAGWSEFNSARAPVEDLPGFVVLAMAALWTSAWLSDGFAFRAGVGLESVVPDGIIFVFASALAADRLRLPMAALWLVAAALVVALQRSMRDEAGGWLTGHRNGVATSALRVGGLLGVIAVGGSLLLGPALPGAGEEALLDTRGRGSGGVRQAISPLVDIRGRLTDRSDDVVFTVESNQPAYWRLTALDEFDGRIWSSARGYGDASGILGGGLPERYTAPARQTVTIEALDTIWLPAAFSPVDIDIAEDVRYDADTASFVTRRGTVESGQSYVVESRIPRLAPDVLQRANGPIRQYIAEHYLALPGDYPPVLRTAAQRIVGDASSHYDQARRLQDYFHQNFTYSLEVPKGHGSSAIEDFLERRSGYCEQFAGTFAAFARSLGIPARVAVGFTPGDRLDDGLYAVKGKHAHAWPEVYFTNIGWVAFEPTPGRGAPGAEAYTGLTATQEGGPVDEQTPSTTVASTPVSTSPTPSNQLAGDDPLAGLPLNDLGASDGASSGGGLPSWLTSLGRLVLVATLVAGAWLLVVPWLVRRRWERRRAAATTNAERVLLAWYETTSLLARAGTPADPSETPREYAFRAEQHARLDGVGLRTLAEQVTAAAYAGVDLPDQSVGAADEVRDTVSDRLVQRLGWRDRLWWRADPRPLVASIPDSQVTLRTHKPVG
jgi:transglutaminase-like putative cysteine protease